MYVDGELEIVWILWKAAVGTWVLLPGVKVTAFLVPSALYWTLPSKTVNVTFPRSL